MQEKLRRYLSSLKEVGVGKVVKTFIYHFINSPTLTVLAHFDASKRDNASKTKSFRSLLLRLQSALCLKEGLCWRSQYVAQFLYRTVE